MAKSILAKKPATRSIGPRTKKTRSRAGCLTCRQRKVKCDEVFVNGHCGNCRRVERQCDTGLVVTFRNEQNPSISRPKNSMQNFYTYRNTFRAGTTWVPVPAELQFIEVDATKILEGDQDDITPKKKNAEPVSIYPQLLPPAQQSQDQTWRAAQMSEGLHALSDAAAANEERTLHPQDLTIWDYDEYDDDDPDDDDYAPEQDLLPLAQHQQEYLRRQQHQNDMDMQAETETQEYNDGSLDFFLSGDTAHASDHIDPNLERLTAGAVDQMDVKFDGLSEEDMEWLRSQQPVGDVTKG